MQDSPNITLDVSTCALDNQCKATLQKLLNYGWNKADTSYTTTQQILSQSELSHLLKRGGIGYHHAPMGVLKSYAVPKFGAGAGVEIEFKLNVNLS